jgi:capsid protein
MIAIGLGTTYEYLMQDYSNMSFSSSRTNLLDMTLTMQEWQRFIISKFLSRVYPTWVSMRMESGRLPFNDEALNGITWQQPAELGVDPQKDASANIELLRAGLTTYEDLYQKDGKNFERAIRQKALEVKRIQDLADEMGVAPELISNVLPPGVAAPGGTPPANVPPPTVKPDANTRPAK